MTYPLAFVAGLTAFFSPCVLPLLPVYLAYFGGQAEQSRLKLLGNLLLFMLGFSLVFTGLGASATAIGSFLLSHQVLLARLAGVVLVVFGLQMLGLFKLPLLQKRLGFNITPQRTPVGFFLFGVVLAAAWTPCVGTVLLSILLLAGSLDTVWQGVSMLFVFSLGFGLPFVAAGLLLSGSERLLSAKAALVIQRVAAVILLAAGVLLVLGQWQTISQFFTGG